MATTSKQKIFKSAIGIILSVLLFFSSSVKIPFVDIPTDNYFQESITKAGIAYASCRVINASVSVIQHSTLELEPAGVGVSLAVGQALDPINDMTERLSDVLVTAIVSLGVQKLAYEISIWFAPIMAAILLVIFSVLIWFKNERWINWQRNILHLILLIAVVRFCLPISSLANNLVHKHFFEERITEANHQLTLGSKELDTFSDFSLPKVDGIMGTIENSTAFLAKKAREFKKALSKLVDNMGDMIDNLLKLTFLYIGLFVIQVIVLPILSFWGMTRLANSLFKTNIPVTLQQQTLKNISTE